MRFLWASTAIRSTGRFASSSSMDFATMPLLSESSDDHRTGHPQPECSSCTTYSSCPPCPPRQARLPAAPDQRQIEFAVPTARSIPAATPSCSYAVNEPPCQPMDDQVEVHARREALMLQQSAHTSLGQDLKATAPRVPRQHPTSTPSYNSGVLQLKSYLASRCGRRSRGKNSGILKTLQQLGIVARNKVQACGDFLPVPVTLDVRIGNLTRERRFGGVRLGSRPTRTAVAVF